MTGVSFDTSKTKVYIPSGLNPELFDFGDRRVAIHHPRHEAVLKRGLVHVGVPLGTNSMEEQFVTEFLLGKERIAALLPKFPLHSALALASQALIPSAFYLVNNVFPSKNIMAAYKQFDEAVVTALWTCLELDDVAVCTHATAVAKTIMSLPGREAWECNDWRRLLWWGP